MQYIHNNDPWPEGKVTSKNNSENCTVGVSLDKSHNKNDKIHLNYTIDSIICIFLNTLYK